MSALVMLWFAGSIAFGVVAFGVFCVCLFPTQHSLRDAWLETLTKEERKAYWHHEKRKKQYIKLRRRQSEICQAILQKAYDEGHEVTWMSAWLDAAVQVNINQFNDVMLADDCPGLLGGSEAPYRWRKKMERPPGV